MMRLKAFIGSLLLVVLLPGCQREPDVAPELANGPSLNIAIDFPSTTSQSKSPELPASALENKIHNLKVWVFRSDNHSYVGYKELSSESDFPVGGGVRRYSMNVGWAFVNEHPDVDVFVLANDASVGCSSLSQETSYDTLVSTSFGYTDDTHDDFGITTPVKPEHIAAEGLPMSGMSTHMTVQGTSPQLSVDAVAIRRAVSRMRLVFCKTHTEGEEQDVVSVDGITFYKGQFSLREYLFTESRCAVVKTATPESANYVDSPLVLSGPTGTLGEHEVPENFVYVNQDPADYQQLLDDAVAAGQVSDLGYLYLRETDQRLQGRIDYTVNGKSRFREFFMSSSGDFARNHTWTLFAYFMSGRNLQFSLVASPWDKSDYAVDFSDQAVTVNAKFTVDDTTAEITDGTEYKEVKLIPGVAAKCHLYITTPVGGTLMIYPKGAATLFVVSPEQATIDPDYEGGRIDIEIRNNPNIEINIDDLPESETSITLSFLVEINGREINIDSEAIDTKYRFHL